MDLILDTHCQMADSVIFYHYISCLRQNIKMSDSAFA